MAERKIRAGYYQRYDRKVVYVMCPPVCCTGGNFRKKAAQDKLGLLKELMNE